MADNSLQRSAANAQPRHNPTVSEDQITDLADRLHAISECLDVIEIAQKVLTEIGCVENLPAIRILDGAVDDARQELEALDYILNALKDCVSPLAA